MRDPHTHEHLKRQQIEREKGGGAKLGCGRSNWAKKNYIKIVMSIKIFLLLFFVCL